jgi:predicted enzyme related to lactoylglutathione lyase
MQLAFVYAPVDQLAPAVAFYRDTLGWSEAWREGDHTVAFAMPGTEVQLMVSVDDGPAGPMFLVDDVREHLTANPGIPFTTVPTDIPDGTIAITQDPAGNPIYLLDQASTG